MLYDVIIVGGGQSGLAVAYYLRKTELRYLILDAEEQPGGSWQNYWSSLKLFSPAQWSSLPGTVMPGGTEHYPTQQEVVDYLSQYEEKYQLKVERPVRVESITHEEDVFHLQTSSGLFRSRAIVGATGSFKNPWIPPTPGLEDFNGQIIHAAQYKSPDPFAGKRVGLVGEGNSGAQILAELSKTAQTFWITKNKPDYLPDHVDGRYLFNAATQLYEAKRKGRQYIPPSLGDIVMVPSVKEARERGVLNFYPPIVVVQDSGAVLFDGTFLELDVLIFCTGYRSELGFLEKLPVTIRFDKIHTYGTHSRELPGLWMVGYGSWTGFASATLIGVGRSAKTTAAEIIDFLR